MPFNRFRTPDGRSVDTVLGPEMKSTGEVMGFDADFGTRVRQGAGRGVRLAAAPSGTGVRLDGQPRQAAHDLPDQGAGRPRLRDPRDPGHRRGAAPQRRAGRRSCASTSRAPGPNGEPTTVQLILDGDDRPGRSTRRTARRQRRLGRASTATRSAPPRSAPTSRASPPSRGSAPRCRASRRWIRGDIGVRSLQDWAAARLRRCARDGVRRRCSTTS